MNDLRKIFRSEKFGKLRTLIVNDEIFFVGKDVAEALGFKNARDAINNHVDNEDKGVAPADTLGGKQSLTIINESGLYALVFGSGLKSAKAFKHWVTSEVLPTLRKTGIYTIKQPSIEPLEIEIVDRELASTINISKKFEALGVAPVLAKTLAFKTGLNGKYKALNESNVNMILKALPPAENEESQVSILTPTDIAEEFKKKYPKEKITSQTVNNVLNYLGYQKKINKKWVVTEKGKEYAGQTAWAINGVSGFQLKWKSTIVDNVLEEYYQKIYSKD